MCAILPADYVQFEPAANNVFPAHEQTQHRLSKGLGECGDIVQRQRHERAVRSKSAIGDEQV